MLIEFRVANFRSFKEEQTFSFVASKDEKHPGNLIPCGKFNLLKTAVLYGANASGKSNLFHAILGMWHHVVFSATRINKGDPIPWVVPFRLDRTTDGEPSLFEVSLQKDDTRYQYGFTLTRERIHDEWLYVFPPPPARRRHLLDRHLDLGTGKTEWRLGRLFKKRAADLLKEMTGDNVLALSRGAQLGMQPLSDVYSWFVYRLKLFDSAAVGSSLTQPSIRHLIQNPSRIPAVLDVLKAADLGIAKIEALEEWSFPGGREGTTQEKGSTGRADDDEITVPKLRTFHDMTGEDMQVAFDLSDESAGTQQLFALSVSFLNALESGATIVVDELEHSMHPLLTRKLIEHFQSSAANKNGAQLLFTTHDSTLMTPSLLRRDQIWLVEKNEQGASELLSLYDFKTRNDEAYQRNYLAGRYGAVPNFGAFFDHLGD